MDALASLVDRDSLSNSTAVPPHKNNGNSMLIAWLALQLAGQVTLPFLVVTMIFHKKIAKRNPTVINLCLVWTLATIPPLLLFYAGKQTTLDVKKDPLLCLTQAATVSAVPPMAATAYLAVVIHACTVINDIISASAIRPVSFDIRTIILISSPYVAFLTFSLLVAIFGAQNPQNVTRSLFFCEVVGHHLSFPVFGYSIVVVVLTLVAQVWISVMFYRHWCAKRKGRVVPGQESHIDLQLLLRMMFFTVFEIVIVISCIGAISNPRFGAAEILIATPPFAVFLIFATSPDILRAWFPCCVRRKPVRTLADVAITSQTPVAAYLDPEWEEPPLRSPPMAELRVRTHDLEMGPPSPRRDSRTATVAIVYPASSSPESPMQAMRAFRSAPGPRPTRTHKI